MLSNLGNIGDLFIASKAIAFLKAAYPNAEWGLLISPRSKAALDLLGDFKRVHFFEHWRECKAALHSFKSRWKAIREIQDYDMAIDLHPFYPNAVPLLRAAKIPVRVGYASGGFGALLTHAFQWEEFGKYLGDLHIDHLMQVGVPLKESFFVPKIPDNAPFSEKYLIMHMCSSRAEKDWERERWIELIRKLEGWQIVLTGQGVKDAAECEAVATRTGCLNFCDQTTMPEYAALLQKAKALITVDSMGVHLASFFNLPTLVLFSDVEFPPLWLPQGALSILMGNDSVEKIARFVHTELR